MRIEKLVLVFYINVYKEYEGNLIYLLQSAYDFIKNNSKVRFEKKDEYRVDKPDYSMRAVTEALVNALIHRDYIIMGSEIHIDMYDDRVEIQSPGGMFSGKPIQEYDLDSVGSMRRNPVLADLFHRMKYMERRGSGLRKILNETKNLSGYDETMKPEFISTSLDFRVILKNVNYDGVHDGVHDVDEKILALLVFCEQPRSRSEMTAFMNVGSRAYFVNKYLRALLADGKLAMTIPDKPKSKNQKYVRVK